MATAAPAAAEATQPQAGAAGGGGERRGSTGVSGILRQRSQGSCHGPRPDRAVWDEENLAENAAYMAANPKQKIDEPPTPYNRYQMEDDADLQEGLQRQGSVEAVEAPTQSEMDARMQMVGALLQHSAATESKQCDGGDGAESPPRVAQGEEEGEAAQAERDHEEFKMKRRAVYAAEGASFKALLQKGGAVDDDDEDEDDEPEEPAQ
eukprot:TRINITY_DN67354_c0_g1_i1.p1 TRINITY_DN67354_c0_g1~~TRINITY_DN67354_c0_g1_i1.p1  ORF type:complete len:229 (+),score=69.70 TRINITY_DN67354_c0_g1_i1:69-689(+)